ncbi:MAG: hypothetical protein ACR652_22560 [Methylocystis sp.]|uniref:hypothetical protein n=1 Tax=Methylocystis sp. TaxID=1911079 RepID=UPI003DA62C61
MSYVNNNNAPPSVGATPPVDETDAKQKASPREGAESQRNEIVSDLVQGSANNAEFAQSVSAETPARLEDRIVSPSPSPSPSPSTSGSTGPEVKRQVLGSHERTEIEKQALRKEVKKDARYYALSEANDNAPNYIPWLCEIYQEIAAATNNPVGSVGVFVTYEDIAQIEEKIDAMIDDFEARGEMVNDLAIIQAAGNIVRESIREAARKMPERDKMTEILQIFNDYESVHDRGSAAAALYLDIAPRLLADEPVTRDYVVSLVESLTGEKSREEFAATEKHNNSPGDM